MSFNLGICFQYDHLQAISSMCVFCLNPVRILFMCFHICREGFVFIVLFWYCSFIFTFVRYICCTSFVLLYYYKSLDKSYNCLVVICNLSCYLRCRSVNENRKARRNEERGADLDLLVCSTCSTCLSILRFKALF